MVIDLFLETILILISLAILVHLPLGYNHPRIVEHMDKMNVHLFAQRQALNIFPQEDFIDQLHTVYPQIQPSNNHLLKLTTTGSEAVENAIKLCHHFHYKKQFQEQIPPYHDFSSIRNSDP